MGNKAKAGILYYSMDCDHPANKKVKLLISDQGPAGYLIWQFLLSAGYCSRGYYFDATDPEELELFAQDVCKQPLEAVHAVIETALRRRLFNEQIYRDHSLLTSLTMQDTYLKATAERRRKGTLIELAGDLLLLSQKQLAEAAYPGKILILPRKNPVLPGSEPQQAGELPGNNPQSRVKESKVDGGDTIVSPGGSTVPGQDDGAESLGVRMYQDVPKDKRSIFDFLRTSRPAFIEPYVDFWNLFAGECGMPQVKTISEARRRKFRIRIKESGFDFPGILKKAAGSEMILTGTWFSFDWILDSPNNYVKVLEGNYDNKKSTTDGSEHTQRDRQQTGAAGMEAAILRKASGG